MGIGYKDFVPQVVNKQLFGAIKEYEDIAEVVSRVNRWLEQQPVRVLNVETVQMAKAIRDDDERTPAYVENMAGTQVSFQVVRVWFEEAPAEDRGYTGQTQRLA